MTEIELAHAALNEAAKYRDKYADRWNSHEGADHWARVAQVHATLALAEREAGE